MSTDIRPLPYGLTEHKPLIFPTQGATYSGTDEKQETLVVNLFAGPGTGKSTTAAFIFGLLKDAGVSCELVHEVAKAAVWEDRRGPLGFQPYIFGKQAYHVHRLLGKVDVIITDSPILLSSHIYGDGQGYSEAGLRHLSLETLPGWRTANISLDRNLEDHPTVDAGRTQSLYQAIAIDEEISHMLVMNGIEHEVISEGNPWRNAQEIFERVEGDLNPSALPPSVFVIPEKDYPLPPITREPQWIPPWPQEHEYDKHNPNGIKVYD